MIQKIKLRLWGASFTIPLNASVGFLGPAHSFSHILAQERFPGRRFVDYQNFGDAFVSLLDKKCDYALIPFYNTNGRDVIEAQKEILRHSGRVFVNDLLDMHIEHNACGYGEISQIKEVRSKRPVEKQISKWLAQTVPSAIFKESLSTSAAIQGLAETKDPAICAVGSRNASVEYGVPIIMEKIENKPNKTLFFLLATTCPTVIKLETIILSITNVTEKNVEDVVQIIEEHECGMTALSKFLLDGTKHAYLEICAFHANLNLHSLEQQVTARFSNATFLGGYNNASIPTLVNK